MKTVSSERIRDFLHNNPYRAAFIIGSVFALIAIFFYSYSLTGQFVNWDDPIYITANPEMNQPLENFVPWAMTTFRHSIWHPVTWLSYKIDFELWGLNPFGYKMTNLLLHALNTVLVSLFVLMFISATPGAASKDAVLFGAGLAAGGFALHPLHVESVVWISERKDLLFSVFWLGALILYVKYTSAGSRKAVGMYMISLFLFALSLMSKPMAVTLPAVLLMLDVYPLRWRGIKSLVDKVPFFALSAFTSLLTLSIHELNQTVSRALPDYMKFWVAIKSLYLYFQRSVLPVGLSPLYPLPRQYDYMKPEYLGSLVLLCLIIFICVLLVRRSRIYLWGIVFMFVTISPTLGHVQVGEHSMADRFMYIPLLGLLMILATEATHAYDRFSGRRGLIILTAAAWMLALGVGTFMQAAHWQNTRSLWERTLAITPESSTINFYAGVNNYREGMYEEALVLMEKVMVMEPEFPQVYYFTGLSRLKLGDFSGADEVLKAGLFLRFKVPETRNTNFIPYHSFHYSRAEALKGMGEYDRAIDEVGQAIKIAPDIASYYMMRAGLYKNINAYLLARLDFMKILELEPDNHIILNELFNLHMLLGELTPAMSNIDRAIQLQPNSAGLFLNRGNLYFELGEIPRAVEDYRRAARLGLQQARDYLDSKGIQWRE
ncbi:hypothetical protein ACFLZI_03060 [Nitrospirota bacterium]